jgi:chromosome segregation ATPase
MPRLDRWTVVGWLGMGTTMLACGCTTFWAPWGPPRPATPPPGIAAAPGPDQNPVRSKAAIAGSELNLKPDESAAERALEVTHKLTAVEEERKVLAARVQQLETALEEKDKALAQVSKEVQAASEEMAQARDELQRWKQQVVVLREKLGGAEKDNLATLQSIVSYLEHMAEQDKPPVEKRPDKEQEPSEAPTPAPK